MQKHLRAALMYPQNNLETFYIQVKVQIQSVFSHIAQVIKVPHINNEREIRFSILNSTNFKLPSFSHQP